jgi:hypothetical protein
MSMKLQVCAAVATLLGASVAGAALLAAGPAGAQGTFHPGGRLPHMPAQPGYHPLPAAGAGAEDEDDDAGGYGARRPHVRAPALPEPKPFKPYEPPKYVSPYAAPPSAPRGAKPCELSVYVNACQHQH